MNIWIILLRFIIVFVMSLIFGYDRQKAHKPIGFGTYIYVAIGACGLGITAIEMNKENPLPLLSAIITGIGFLGAGALIKTSDRIFGFSSAATIWVFSIVGLMIGTGEYFIGTVTYILIWIVVFIDRSFEHYGIGSYQKKLMIVSNQGMKEEELEAVLGTKKFKIVSVETNKKVNQVTVNILIEGTRFRINQIPTRLYKTHWVDSFKLE